MLFRSTTLVPLRIISEELGAVVEWEHTKKRVTIQKGKDIIELYIGSKNAYVNGNPISLLTPPSLTVGITLVPIRFISEQLGADVQWDNKEKIVSINQ